jgi:hypothetical protein
VFDTLVRPLARQEAAHLEFAEERLLPTARREVLINVCLTASFVFICERPSYQHWSPSTALTCRCFGNGSMTLVTIGFGGSP